VLGSDRIAVVVPARNEARWIAETLTTLPVVVDVVVLIDDASEDGTVEVAEALRPVIERRHALAVEQHEAQRGVGAAIVSGYRRALELGADVVVVMAGDGQMHPDDLGAVVEPVVSGRADYAKGNRLGHPTVWRCMPTHRLVANHVLSRLTGLAAGVSGLRDSQCGYTAIRREVLERLDLSRLWTGYGYPNDLLGAVRRCGFRVVDVPIRPVYRGEASGLRAYHLLVIGGLIGRVAARRLSDVFRSAASPRGDLDRPTAPRTPPARWPEPAPTAPPERPTAPA
jgi:glycosyltransferase involved in cell wall biosynthesis